MDAGHPVRRPLAVLAPLALYLTSGVTMPALMWWTACLNQLPIQLAFFLAVGAWVRYLRGDGLLWLSVPAVPWRSGCSST